MGQALVKLAEVPAFALNGSETRPYSLEEVATMRFGFESEPPRRRRFGDPPHTSPQQRCNHTESLHQNPSPDAIAAMNQLANALLFSTWAPEEG